jgi:hypothetical protein
MIAAMFGSAVVFAQLPVAQQEASVRVVAPIAVTVDGFDTGLTVVNVSGSPLRVCNFVFFSLSGDQSVGAEAAGADLINRKLSDTCFDVPANGRWSMLLSELLGLGINGQLRFSVIGPGAFQALIYEAILDPNFTADSIKLPEVTRREQSPAQ